MKHLLTVVYSKILFENDDIFKNGQNMDGRLIFWGFIYFTQS
jgi:hypothetical protein